MPEERYKHIFLTGPTRTQGFTNPRRGGSAPRIPVRDRAGHSTYLKQRLEEAWREVKQRQAVVHVERQGAYIDFVSEPGFDLAIQSLEALRSGIRLRNIRKDSEGGLEQTLATVYVPYNKRSYFLRKIQSYATEVDRRSKRPKNAKLVDSISDIKLAVLESFWCMEERTLIPGDISEWIEVWLSSDLDEIVSRFEMLSKTLNCDLAEGVIKFPERSVKLIRANRNQLEQLIENSDNIAELKLAEAVATFYSAMENKNQLVQAKELLARCQFDDKANVAICILDTGINNGHLLINPVLDDNDLHTVMAKWGTHDHDGHGTLMAGTSTYGDLLPLLLKRNTSVHVQHCLESVKILPPHPEQNPKELWGYIMTQGISRAEIQKPESKRIICMAITAIDDRVRGRPSSWSGTVDELASGYEDDTQRLIVISAGNADPDNWQNYPEANLTDEVHDPGQAWNALTVGAFTKKTRITDPLLGSYTAIAPMGGLSPHSTTSRTWPSRKWPIKPDVVFEGGNVAQSPDNSVLDSDDLKLLSTYRDPQTAQFAPFNATSAACAQAARIAAQIQVQYPQAWPETVRALIVHSADWTDTMKQQFLKDETKTAYAQLLRICGYGTPDFEHAMYCLSNSLTLISQARLQPYDKRGTQYVTRDMHLYNLPWPKDVLSELGEEHVTMRVTLSYFIEPSPGEIGWENRYRYASHTLRFDVNGPGETEDEFVRRVNTQARDDGEHPGTAGSGENWVIGEARNVGSIHSDIWQGRAADLAGSNMIAVYPAVGWWRERNYLNRWNRSCRYSLIVSIRATEHIVDIYTPVINQIKLSVPIKISVNRE